MPKPYAGSSLGDEFNAQKVGNISYFILLYLHLKFFIMGVLESIRSQVLSFFTRGRYYCILKFQWKCSFVC